MFYVSEYAFGDYQTREEENELARAYREADAMS